MVLACFFKNSLDMNFKLSDIILFPFFLIYFIIVNIRNLLYDKKIYRGVSFDIPIISVGNLSAGGNGKTPLVEYIIRLLSSEMNIAVLSRGYGRNSKGYHEVSSTDTALYSGDEPLQIKQGFGDKIKVFVGENRVEAITKIMFDFPETELIILDDAFQHRAITPGLNLLLTDYSLPFYKDRLIPLGRLREPKIGASRADAIIITKCPEKISLSERNLISKSIEKYSSIIFFSGLKYGKIIDLEKNEIKTGEKKFFLVTAIANHKPLEDFVKSNYNLMGSLHFRDHHKFTKTDLVSIEQKIANFADPSVELLTTTKDAVRFKDIYSDSNPAPFVINVISVQPDFTEENEMMFKQFIKKYVRENSTDSSVYSVED